MSDADDILAALELYNLLYWWANEESIRKGIKERKRDADIQHHNG